VGVPATAGTPTRSRAAPAAGAFSRAIPVRAFDPVRASDGSPPGQGDGAAEADAAGE